MIHRFDAAPHPDARARNRRARRMERARLAHLSSGSALDARPRAMPRVARAMAPPTPTVPQRVLVGDDARALLEHIEETVRDGGDPEGAVERRRAYVRARAERSGKAPLHLAAWRGSPDVVRALLDDPCRADIDQISTGRHNYGKTAIFYALTRSRCVRVVHRTGHRSRARRECTFRRLTRTKTSQGRCRHVSRGERGKGENCE